VLLADYFQDLDPEEFFGRLDGWGRDLGVRFGTLTLMSNSRQALQAGEFAKDHGLFVPFHEALFRAYFTDLRDIGDRQVVLDVAGETGLDASALDAALDNGAYMHRLEAATRLAREKGVTAAPTFEIAGQERIVGAVPLETFRTALRGAAG
jgi:predicted DsbA family dithiol-disulfide isomerase